MTWRTTLAAVAAIALLALAFHSLREGNAVSTSQLQEPGAAEGREDASKPTEAQPSPGAAPIRTSTPEHATAAPSAQSIPATAPLPLPPLDTPLADVLDELRERADAGDAAAACRLSAELSLCAQVAGFDPRHYEPGLAERPREREHRLERMRRDSARHQHCQGLPDGLLVQQARFHLAAAQLGDTDAALRFLYGRWLERATLLHDPSLARLYRQHAWPLFLRLFEDGNPHTAFLWADAAADTTQRIPLSAVLPEQWRRPEVANGLVLEILGSSVTVHDRFPRPSAVAHAEAIELFRQHFATSSHYHGGPPPPPPVTGDPEACESLRSPL